MAKKPRKKKKTASKRKSVKRKKAPKKAKAKKKKKTAAKKAARKKVKAAPKGPKLPAEPVGRVTHYFPKAKATAVMIEREDIRVGDVLYYKGHTTGFKQKVESLQIDRQPVSEASEGQEVGIQVRSRTREHDLVFKL